MIKIIDNIILVGTSHVAKESIKNIEKVIVEYNPEVIGIELDVNRFKSLMEEKKEKEGMSFSMIKEIGLFGFLFASIGGYMQKKIAKNLNVMPGLDMKAAYLKAREMKIPVSLIDIDIRITLKKLSNLSFFKKMSIITGIFFKSFKKENREMLDFDLNKIPKDELISKMMNILKKEVPALYKILIEDRNIHMINKLLRLKEKHNGYIMAVVGAGHVEGMYDILIKKLENTPNISFSFHSEFENPTGFIQKE